MNNVYKKYTKEKTYVDNKGLVFIELKNKKAVV